jgi:CrcB protein
MNALWVFLGGGLGSALRYLIALAVLRWRGTTVFPWATLAANTLAALFMALTLAWYLKAGSELPDRLRYLIVVGFCGGLSTFSTFGYENLVLLQSGQWGWMVANVVISLGATLAVMAFFLYR